MWNALIWVAGLRLKFHGPTDLIDEGPCIVAVNHQSVLDIPGTVIICLYIV